MELGQVVIVDSGQAGTVCEDAGGQLWVLLANLDVWVGPPSMCRIPQDEADLAACPLNVERLESKRIIK
jgi:hypothetical protein